jgi:hypothetical protein
MPIVATLVDSIVPQMLGNFYGVDRRVKAIEYPKEAVLAKAQPIPTK